MKIYYFGKKRTDGRASGKLLLGGKGANLAEMCHMGIPVPPGFTISTEVCHLYQKHKSFPEELTTDIQNALSLLEEETGKKFGSRDSLPLLVSVRSGSPVSMPGMMDTILNLGLNDDTVQSLARETSGERFAWDSYRRFIQMFSDVVLGVPHHFFEETLTQLKKKENVLYDYELSAQALKILVAEYKKITLRETGSPFPESPLQQLHQAVEAVFKSWNNRRATTYRKIHAIPETLCTAVNVQSMVFGNLSANSGTGVVFTRNPSTGENLFYGEYLQNAQGEDVVAGIRTPKPISSLESDDSVNYLELKKIASKLEAHFHDMQDIEFTIEQGKLFILQTRSGKRTAPASLHIAMDSFKEGLIDRETALMRIDPEALPHLLANVFNADEIEQAANSGQLLATGLPAGPGAASGAIAFSADRAVEFANQGKPTILVRLETSPEDIAGMEKSRGILTARGGMTSHAAVVARGMNKPCVAGASDLVIHERELTLTIQGRAGIQLKEGDTISIDGYTGSVYAGELATSPSEIHRVFIEKSLPLENSPLAQKYYQLMQWVEEISTLGVRANADTGADASHARSYGAQGIGLARTEHMFFSPQKIMEVRKMILAETEEERAKALEQMLEFQEHNFYDLFREMDGFPVTIRLLDPPLHEFLPVEPSIINEIAEELGIPAETVLSRARSLREINPMLGHRGCRLGITFPEITAMQARAIFLAAHRAINDGYRVHPEIMIPLAGHWKEVQLQKKVIEDTYRELQKEKGLFIPFRTGSMIEVPRAALTSDEIAREADFFSFGTNDLTQMTLGFSRDDSGTFIPQYLEHKIYESDPFRTLDMEGVGSLIRIALDKARAVKPDIPTGICGEHGGDPKTIAFAVSLGMDYVSVSPFRVPVARLAAAQAKISLARNKNPA